MEQFIFFGSRSRSRVKKQTDILTVNYDTLELANKEVSKIVTNIMMDHAKECGQNVEVTQLIDFSGATIGGNLNIGHGNDCKVALEIEGVVSFKCLQASDITREARVQVTKEILQGIESAFSTDSIDKMAASINQKASSGSLSTSQSDVSSTNSDYTKVRSISKVNRQVVNEVIRNVESNLRITDVQKCITNVRLKQGLDSSGIQVQGDVNLCNFTVKAVFDVVSECLQKSRVGEKIMSDFLTSSSIKIDTSNALTSTSNLDTDTKQESVTTGVIQDIGKAVTDIISSFTFLPVLISMLPIIICVICIACIIIVPMVKK